MKRITAITLALFCAGAFVKPVHAVDNSTEFGVADDLGVFGTGGTATDPDVEIKGFTLFGSTGVTGGITIPAAPGNIFINGYVGVSSGMYVAAYSTFSAGMYVAGESTFNARINLPVPGSIFLPDGTAGQILRKKADGSLEWSAAPITGSGTQYKIPIWDAVSGTQLGNSVLIQEAAGGGITVGGTSSMTVNGLFEARSNSLIGGTLGVTGASTLNGNVSISGANTFTVGTGATALGGALGVTGASTLNGNVSISGANTFTVGTGATALGGALNVTGVVTVAQIGAANTDIHGVNVAAEAGTALAIKGTATSGQFITKFYSNTSLAAWLKNK